MEKTTAIRRTHTLGLQAAFLPRAGSEAKRMDGCPHSSSIRSRPSATCTPMSWLATSLSQCNSSGIASRPRLKKFVPEFEDLCLAERGGEEVRTEVRWQGDTSTGWCPNQK